MIALLACQNWALADSNLQFQSKATFAADSLEIPHYLIQVEYRSPTRPHGGRGYGGHYGGYGYGYGGYGFRYSWFTIAQTDDLEEAEFIFALYQLAWESGVLHEVAPDFGPDFMPTRVRMITEYRTLDFADMAAQP
jgi:hypothetical protein